MHLVSLVIIFFLASSQGINLLSDSDTHLYSSSKEIEGANTIALTLHRWIVSIPPPGDEKITKNAWKVCFSIFLRYLLPTAIAFFGLMQMFSAEPPSYVLIEKLGKRLFIAILIAYFGFTVVDFMCKLTNFIGELIIKSLSSNGYFSLAELMMLLLPSSLLAIIGSTSASSLAILPVLSTFISSITTFLILVFVLLFTRIAVVHITAALLPIFCFFIIIGIGPFKKLKEIAEKFCDEFPHIYQCERDRSGNLTRKDKQELLTKLNRRVISKLESKGYVEREKVGRNTILRLTQHGELFAPLEGNLD